MGALLWIIGVLLVLGIASWLAWGASQFSANIIGILIFAGIVLFFFYWVFFGNSNMAEAEFKRLCETEAKATIFKTVILPAEYFDEYGLPKLTLSKKPGITAEMAGRYVTIVKEEAIPEKPRLTKVTRIERDSSTDETLGVITTISYVPSYAFPVPGEVRGQDCPGKGFISTPGHDYYQNFLLGIYKKQS